MATTTYHGVSHLALSCDDMARTVEFYTKVMNMELIKSMEMQGGLGQHFFFDIGNGDILAFICWNDVLARPAAPGIAAPARGAGPSANGSMNHIAFRIEPDEVEPWYEHFTKLGIDFLFKAHNSNRPDSNDLNDLDDETFCASIYLWDPDGARLELCAWMPAWDKLGNDVVPMSRKVPVGHSANN